MSTTEIHEAATHRPTMAELTARLAVLLELAVQLDLPQPWYITVSRTGSIDLQFPPEMDSVTAIISWASVYFGAMRSDSHEGRNGPEIWPSTQFIYDGVSITAYAHIPVPVEGPADLATQHADYPHEPGYLYDCPACQSRCHCTPDAAPCVYDGPHEVPPF